MSKGRAKGSGGHRFGGDWTEQKLGVLGKYLSAYTTALKNTPFRKIYIDAFAGTGDRDVSKAADAGGPEQVELFAESDEPNRRALLDGSARIALRAEPRFDQYIFIEKSRERCAALERLKTEFPALARDVEIRQSDANDEIRELCKTSWRAQRAVLFLDPYGMQVEWNTIEAIAQTRAIDLWLLFPLGIGVNRLLTKSGDVPAAWRRRLDLLLGTRDWEEEFYRVELKPDLFGDEVQRVEKATVASIGKYFNRRLSQIFAGVAEPAALRNSTNSPMYLLCFAVGNEKGRPIAQRIANYLLKDLR